MTTVHTILPPRWMLGLLAGLVVAVASPARATPFAYMPSGGALAVVDTATNTLVTTVPLAGPKSSVAVNSIGTLVYVGPNVAGGVTIVDATTNTVAGTLLFPAGSVQGVALNPAGTRLYALVFPGGASPNQVVVVDTATNATLATVTVGQSGAPSLAVNPTGTKVYVPNQIAGTVSVIDAASNTVVATIPASRARTVAFNPAGTRAYVAGASPGNVVTVIDTSTDTVVTTIPIASGPDSVAVNPAGTRLYVTRQLASQLAVVDTATNTVLTNVTLTDGCTLFPAFAIAVTPDGTRAYFGGTGCSGYAAWFLDTATNSLAGSVPLPASGGGGYGLFIGPFCPAGCNDGNPCTTDGCNPVAGCTSTNNSGPCADDGNPCSDDVCDGAGSCTHPPSSFGTSCEDGVFCNGADTCDGAGTCLNAGDPCTAGTECADACNEATDDCFDLVGTGCTSDGNPCTDDECDGSGACAHPANTAPCDDGLFCTMTDVCASGSCGGTGDPCAGGPECADVCNEGSDDCFDPNGVACTADANPCTLDQCDGAGSCGHPAGNPGTVCRSAAGQCDAVETCTGASTACPPDGSQPDGTACTDGDACTNPDVCTAGACTSGAAVVCVLCETCDTSGGCIEAPRSGCKQPTKPLKASIELQDRPDDNDQVKWKWSSGQATTFAELGDPLGTDDYALCVYDASASLLLRMTAPAGGTCGTKPCWKRLGPATLGKGYKYKDLDGLPHDLDSMTLKSGLDGKAKMSLKSKGPNVPLPALGSFALPLTTQLQSRNGQCWEATTTTPSVNTTALFKAKAD